MAEIYALVVAFYELLPLVFLVLAGVVFATTIVLWVGSWWRGEV